MYPSIEVTKSTILREVILPGGSRLLTWNAGKLDEEDTKLGYALYRTGQKSPIFQGYLAFDTNHIATDAGLLELLAVILMSQWDPTKFVHDMEEYATEYTEDQIDWLNSTEIQVLFELLNGYEAQVLDELDPEERLFEWRNDRLYYINTNRKVLEDVSVN